MYVYIPIITYVCHLFKTHQLYFPSPQPDDWHKSVQNEGDGEIGYSRKKTGGGKKGYQHFDSYHKKAGDNYEFEKQDSYGQEEKGQDGAYSNNYEKLGESEKLIRRPLKFFRRIFKWLG